MNMLEKLRVVIAELFRMNIELCCVSVEVVRVKVKAMNTWKPTQNFF